MKCPYCEEELIDIKDQFYCPECCYCFDSDGKIIEDIDPMDLDEYMGYDYMDYIRKD